MMKTRQRTTLLTALCIIGVYIIIDGAGSILIYSQQPLFFDHFFRIVRIVVGIAVTTISWRMMP